jgi:prolipoprotein diacylglyceryltransferase
VAPACPAWRSIQGAVAGGIVAVEVYSAARIRTRTSARFSAAVLCQRRDRRIGCYLAGLDDFTTARRPRCHGVTTPMTARHPVQLYEPSR